jgi:carbamoyl-phosphate synthase large subunit
VASTEPFVATNKQMCQIASGTSVAARKSVGVQRLEDVVAWQLANAFKKEVYRLVTDHPSAAADFWVRDQLRNAAASVGANIGEGFYRFGAREFARFLTIALSSLGEATLWLRDGIDRKHFHAAECEEAFALARRCRITTLRLRRVLCSMADQNRCRR